MAGSSRVGVGLRSNWLGEERVHVATWDIDHCDCFVGKPAEWEVVCFSLPSRQAARVRSRHVFALNEHDSPFQQDFHDWSLRISLDGCAVISSGGPMLNLIQSLRADESGFVVSAELVIVSTTVVLGATVALVAVRDALGGEMADLAESFRSLDQSYFKAGVRGSRKANGTYSAWTAGSSFFDPHLRGDAEQQHPLPEDLELCRSHQQITAMPPTPVILNSPVIPTGPCGPTPCVTPCQPPCLPECPTCSPVLEHPYLPAPILEPMSEAAPATVVPCLSCPPGTNGLLAPTPFSALPNCAAPSIRNPHRLSAPFAPVFNPYAEVPSGPLQVW